MEGGPILPFFPPESTDLPDRGVYISALARRLLDALLDNLKPMASLDDTSAIRKGVLGSGTSPPVWLIILGVALRVPHVMSCFIPVGPSWAGVGDGRSGTRPKGSSLFERG